MEASRRPASRAGVPSGSRVAGRSAFEHDLVIAAISLAACGRYPEVDVVNIDAPDVIDDDLDALASADGVVIVPLDRDEVRVHGLAVRRR
jgi:hypothetical protein